jgi:hypothetical protein
MAGDGAQDMEDIEEEVLSSATQGEEAASSFID